jgi:hypothetical protein
MSNFLYNRAIILPRYRGDREDKELLPCSILEIIRRREVYKVWSFERSFEQSLVQGFEQSLVQSFKQSLVQSFEKSLVQSFEQSSEVRLRPTSFTTDDFCDR